MKWYRYWAAAFAVMLVQSPMTLCAATFYVDGPNGSDARSGQYASAPKKTIQAAIKVASPGESTTVTVTVAKNVEWTVDGIDEVEWLGITGDKTSFVGTQTITTSETKPGLAYTFSECTSLSDGLKQTSSKVGDGTAWTPNVTIKGGTSGFYSIGVRK